jgi:hypothetical protein
MAHTLKRSSSKKTRPTGSLPGMPQSTPLLTYIARVKVTLP